MFKIFIVDVHFSHDYNELYIGFGLSVKVRIYSYILCVFGQYLACNVMLPAEAFGHGVYFLTTYYL